MQNYYEQSVKILTSTEKFHICLGLERIQALLKLFDNPQDKIKIIHVAGTNGKGSFCSIVSSILQSAGYQTGLFTSPHLVKYTERIKINSFPISDKDFYKILTEVENKAKENNIYLTEFEILTAVGFIYFERNKVDFAVIEVGLGGRYDATNIVKKPVLTAITSISLDHTDRLGNTISEIAYEKSGILKPEVKCIVSKSNAGLKVILDNAKLTNAKLITTTDFVELDNAENNNKAIFDGKSYEFSLLGEYQAQNLSLALTAIKELQKNNILIEDTHIKDGLKNVKHNGRFQYIKDLNLIIDGAHNPDGAKVLRNSLNKLFKNKPIRFIYATINTKDYKTILNTLITSADELILYNFNRQNAVPTKELKKVIAFETKIANDTKDVIKIIKQAQNSDIPTILTGSLYAIGELYPHIKKLKYSPTV